MDDWSERVKKRADHNGICLCTVKDLPDWHFQHRGITRGYRYCRDLSSAVKSMFYWHNESINIWSHIIASLGILLYFLTRVLDVLEKDHPALFDKVLVIIVVLVGNIAPLLSSAACHNFYCVNKVRRLLPSLSLLLTPLSSRLFMPFSFPSSPCTSSAGSWISVASSRAC